MLARIALCQLGSKSARLGKRTTIWTSRSCSRSWPYAVKANRSWPPRIRPAAERPRRHGAREPARSEAAAAELQRPASERRVPVGTGAAASASTSRGARSRQYDDALASRHRRRTLLQFLPFLALDRPTPRSSPSLPCPSSTSTAPACRRPASETSPRIPPGLPSRFIWHVEEGGSSAKRWTPLPRKPRRRARSGPGAGRRPVDLLRPTPRDQHLETNT